MDSNEQLKNYKVIIDESEKIVMEFLKTQNLNLLKKAIQIYENFLGLIDITDYLLIDAEHPYVPKKVYVQTYYKLGTYLKTLVEKEIENARKSNMFVFTTEHENIYRKAIFCFITVHRVVFEHDNSISQLMSIYCQLCSHTQKEPLKAIAYLNEALVFSPQNTVINYNLGFMYQKINKLELSLSHYKLAIFTNQFVTNPQEKLFNYISCYNGISGIYRSIKQWPESLFYLLKANAIHPTEPSVCNQLGVTYTEMRRTDLAETFYLRAIENYKSCIINQDYDYLLSEIYLNMGHMYAYNGDNNKSIECYNKSLKVNPTFLLAFQNKIFNLCYMQNEITDINYISKQHRNINTLLKSKNNKLYNFDHLKSKSNDVKLNIGIISGDFKDHPVSYFINPLLTSYDTTKYNIYCYSECVFDITSIQKDLNFKFIKNKSTEEVSKIIYSDNIHILFDLSGHTAFNRLDVFADKPAPIQISYIGYPYTTGVRNMDYRITDAICDNDKISQKYYTEKLLYLNNCFLCYNPVNKDLPLSDTQPFLKNKFITISCFNRLNKINKHVIQLFNKILTKFKNVKFVFKTKALNNKIITSNLLEKFDKGNRDRIIMMECSISHEKHLLEYNNIDIAIDTFPYSGTTTSCESLMMGVPVFSLYDDVQYYHPHNVTTSILKNSDLDNFVFKNENELFTKIQTLIDQSPEYWMHLKKNTRDSFLNGKVCNKELYMKNMDQLLYDTFMKFNKS
jgi:predicted O-linked N-acetylglucosamine transferase (SPINDLY family)